MSSQPTITPSQLETLEAEGWVVTASLPVAEGERTLLRRGEEERFVMVDHAAGRAAR